MFHIFETTWLRGIVLLLAAAAAQAPTARAMQPDAAPAPSAAAVAPITPEADWRSAVRDFAKAHEKNPAWGYSHAVRDYELARSLAATDHVMLDDDVMFAAAYLHDVGMFPPYARHGVDHDDVGADDVGKLLAGTGFPMSKLPAVQAAIRTHMYYRQPVGPESIYLHDADALDWLGSIGVARIFGLVDPRGGQPNGPAAVKQLQDLLAKVPAAVVSSAGKAELARRVPQLRRFLSQLATETSNYHAL